MSENRKFQGRLIDHQSPIHGRVLEIVLVGSWGPQAWRACGLYFE